MNFLKSKNPKLLKQCAKGNLEKVRKYLDKDADVNCKDDKGWSPLHIASSNGNGDIVDLLVENGAMVDAKTDDAGDSDTALHLATTHGHMKVVESLLGHGAQIDEQNKHGRTALHIAADYSKNDIIKFLIEKEANINMKDDVGYTPLHIAARKLDRDGRNVIQSLLDAGADAGVMDNKRNTPVVYVKHQSIRNLLLNSSESDHNSGDDSTDSGTSIDRSTRNDDEIDIPGGIDFGSHNDDEPDIDLSEGLDVTKAPPKYLVGQKVQFKTITFSTVEIVSIQHDNTLVPRYTIKLPYGRVEQTSNSHLCILENSCGNGTKKAHVSKPADMKTPEDRTAFDDVLFCLIFWCGGISIEKLVFLLFIELVSYGEWFIYKYRSMYGKDRVVDHSTRPK